MRRIKLIVALGVVMAAMIALSSGTAMADEWNDWNDLSWNDCGEWDGCGDNNFDNGFDEVIWIPEGTAAFDQWCSPGLPEGIWIPGCIFSDPIEEDHLFDDAVFVIDDIDLDDIDCDDDHFDCDDDCDCDDDRIGDDDRRFHHDDGDEWRFRDDW
jgi:hypothetical protein